MSINISTKRFNLKEVNKSHATGVYLNWLSPKKRYARYIAGCEEGLTLNDIRVYIDQKSADENVIFLAVELKDGTHIGNVKFEPIDYVTSIAEVGILIGDESWQGCGAGSEVLLASMDWLNNNRNINKITLGLNSSNISAYKAYTKIGFRKVSESLDSIRMEKDIC